MQKSIKLQFKKESLYVKSSEITLEVDDLLQNYQKGSASLLSVLEDIQDRFNYLSEDALKSVSEKLEIPLNQVYSVSTFYNAFSLKPKGKYVIQVCRGTACHLMGANPLFEEISSVLHIKEGETTEDGVFSVESVRCLGCCSLAPVISINGKVYGNLKPEFIKPILNKYKT